MGKADGKKNREYPLNIMRDTMRIPPNEWNIQCLLNSTVFYKLAERNVVHSTSTGNETVFFHRLQASDLNISVDSI
jgi:hypothetical protein